MQVNYVFTTNAVFPTEITGEQAFSLGLLYTRTFRYSKKSIEICSTFDML